MNQTAEPVYSFPPKMGKIVLKATEEILGREGIWTVLELAQLHHLTGGLLADNPLPVYNPHDQLTFQDLGKLQVTLEAAYGLRSGQGLALRSGRACFKYGLQEYGSLLGLNSPAFGLLPVDEKLRVGLGLFAGLMNQDTAQSVQVDEEEHHFLWHIERCPVCCGREADTPVCSLVVGFLQESLYWISGGKHFNVEEIACIAKGDPACTMQVDKHPVV